MNDYDRAVKTRDFDSFRIVIYLFILFPLFIHAYNDWVFTPPSPTSSLSYLLSLPPTPSFQAETVLPLSQFC
jgi:hypothetical protein